jgi:hypothetical protein
MAVKREYNLTVNITMNRYLPKIELLCQVLLLHGSEEGVVLLVQRQFIVQVSCIQHSCQSKLAKKNVLKSDFSRNAKK